MDRVPPQPDTTASGPGRTLTTSTGALMTPRRYMPALLLLFVASGCAALIYEIVWFQLLQLVIGSSAVSLAVLLGTFMGGMCLGSFLLPRYISAREHPLRVYAFFEIGIGVLGLLILFGMPALANIYTAWGGRVRRPAVPRRCRQHLPAAADHPDGRDASGDVALGRDEPAGRVVAGLLLRRQHRRRGRRQPARRLLSAARLRHGDRDLRRRGAQHPRRRVGAPRCPRDALRGARGRAREGRACAGRMGGLRRHRALRHDGARLAGHLDAHAVAAVRRDGLHLLADSGGVPLRPRDRQQPRLGAGARPRASAPRARLGADAAVRRDRLGGLHPRALAAVLADRSVDLD